MGKKILFVMVVFAASAVAGCSTAHECGDGVCSGGEDPNSCASDCQCGNGFVDTDFSTLLELQARASNLALKPENVAVPTGLED